jgi:hypothetical protein
MSTSIRRAAAFAAVLIFGFELPTAQAQQRPEIFQAGRAEFGTDLAAGGFDVVAYQAQNQAVAGTGQFRVRWKEAEWRFASLQNRDAFVANPERYAPQYGGWCAFAMAAGVKAASDPRLFDVVGGRLYLNQTPSTQDAWRRDQAAMIQRGDANWPRVARQ